MRKISIYYIKWKQNYMNVYVKMGLFTTWSYLMSVILLIMIFDWIIPTSIRAFFYIRIEHRIRTELVYKNIVREVLCDPEDIRCCEGLVPVEGRNCISEFFGKLFRWTFLCSFKINWKPRPQSRREALMVNLTLYLFSQSCNCHAITCDTSLFIHAAEEEAEQHRQNQEEIDSLFDGLW